LQLFVARIRNGRLDVKLGNGNGVKVYRLERRRQEDLPISNYLSKIELYHNNKINDKTLELMDFETEGR